MSLAVQSPAQSYLDAEELGDTADECTVYMGGFLQLADEYDEYNMLYGHLFTFAERMPTAQDALSGALRYFRDDAVTPRDGACTMGHYWEGIIRALSSDGQRLQSTFGAVFANLTSAGPSEPT